MGKRLQIAFSALVVSVLPHMGLGFTLASPGSGARIVVGVGEPECVWLAATDLRNDVREITGRELDLVRGGEAGRGDVFIATEKDGRWEAYTVRTKGDVLRIVGSDARGTMFGVYDFIERYLGVDPMGFWSDIECPSHEALSWEEVAIDQDEPTVRFRGWFVNDEDLLTKWKDPSGVRDYSTYRYYGDVVSAETMEKVVEALVRSRMNLIIPASLLNISRPAEEHLVSICARRGVYVSMHHIEPMGVSGYAFKDYWKRRGRDLEFSYFKHPQEMEETWREMSKRWAKYPNVIWQIGLRGTGDRPMWREDPTIPKDDAGRAALISAALARQVGILDEIGVPREGRVVSTTLWAEGAYFNARGLLKIPADTIVVLADNNCGWRWQRDLLDGHRAAGAKHGVYYHHQLITMGPHLVSLVPASKTKEMLVTAREKNALDYAVFNVGNVREFVHGLDATAKMTWNLDSFEPEKWMRAWLARRVPSNVDGWERVLNVYYRSLQLDPTTGLPRFLDGQIWRDYQRRMARIVACATGELPCVCDPEPAKTVVRTPQVNDPWSASVKDWHPPLASPSDTYARLAAQKASYEQVLLFARHARNGTASSERRFAQDFLMYPAEVMHGLTEALMEAVLAEEAVKLGDRAECARCLKAALGAIRRVIVAGEDYCHGEKWRHWYRGCEKVSPREFEKCTLNAIGAVEK